MQLLKLGSKNIDRATGLPGVITHAFIDMDEQVRYLFQPGGLNSDSGAPVHGIIIVGQRFKDQKPLVDVDVPLDVLGTHVEHQTNDFNGMAIGIVVHVDGCVHVHVQPAGTTKKNEPIEPQDFSIRLLKGKAIKKMTEKELATDRAEKPSPAPVRAIGMR